MPTAGALPSHEVPAGILVNRRMRRENQLVQMKQVNGWVSSRLGIKFEMGFGELVIYGPDGERFSTPVQLRVELEQRRQRTGSGGQRAESLAEYMRSLGLDLDNLPGGN
jgi:hypothetical protein